MCDFTVDETEWNLVRSSLVNIILRPTAVLPVGGSNSQDHRCCYPLNGNVNLLQPNNDLVVSVQVKAMMEGVDGPREDGGSVSAGNYQM
jgi:hypothetical protein